MAPGRAISSPTKAWLPHQFRQQVFAGTGLGPRRPHTERGQVTLVLIRGVRGPSRNQQRSRPVQAATASSRWPPAPATRPRPSPPHTAWSVWRTPAPSSSPTRRSRTHRCLGPRRQRPAPGLRSSTLLRHRPLRRETQRRRRADGLSPLWTTDDRKLCSTSLSHRPTSIADSGKSVGPAESRRSCRRHSLTLARSASITGSLTLSPSKSENAAASSGTCGSTDGSGVNSSDVGLHPPPTVLRKVPTPSRSARTIIPPWPYDSASSVSGTTPRPANHALPGQRRHGLYGGCLCWEPSPPSRKHARISASMATSPTTSGRSRSSNAVSERHHRTSGSCTRYPGATELASSGWSAGSSARGAD